MSAIWGSIMHLSFACPTQCPPAGLYVKNTDGEFNSVLNSGVSRRSSVPTRALNVHSSQINGLVQHTHILLQ